MVCTQQNNQFLLNKTAVFLLRLVNPFLQYAPDLVVDWVQVGPVWWPQIWWNEVWHLDFQEFDSFASPMRWGPILLKCEVIRVLLNIGRRSLVSNMSR